MEFLPFYFQSVNAGISTANTLIGTFLKNDNHWTLFVIELKAKSILFVDPFGNDELSTARQFAAQWSLFATRWKEETRFFPFPTEYDVVTKQHQLQRDGSTCGIHTLTVGK